MQVLKTQKDKNIFSKLNLLLMTKKLKDLVSKIKMILIRQLKLLINMNILLKM